MYRKTSLTPSGQEAIAATLNGSFDTTVLNVTFVSTPVYEGSSETDIIYEKYNKGVPADLKGLTFCNDANGASDQCDQHYVRWREDTHVRRNNACHETGHAVGLTHGDDADPRISVQAESLMCMRNPTMGEIYLGEHNADTIDFTYVF